MTPGGYGLTTKDGASDLAITAAGTVICDPITDLAGMVSFGAWLKLAYGSGGTTIKAYLQTGFDADRWLDIACAAFDTSSRLVLFNFSAATPKLSPYVPTDGTLADDTAVDGLLGDRLRLKVLITGTYADNTVLQARAIIR